MGEKQIEWKAVGPLCQQEKQVYLYLEALEIPFLAYHHEAAPTVEHVSELDQTIRGRHCKNLFLKNSKGDQLWMLIAPYDKKIDLKQVARSLGSTRLSFGEPERMKQLLGLEPGSVSPFGLINDHEKRVQVLLDSDLLSLDHINFHPNVNTATISLALSDFLKYLETLQRPVVYLLIETKSEVALNENTL